jgi:hypothetical protein
MNRCNAIIAHRGPLSQSCLGSFQRQALALTRGFHDASIQRRCQGPPCSGMIRGGPSLNNICLARRHVVIHRKDTSQEISNCVLHLVEMRLPLSARVTFLITEKISHTFCYFISHSI